jgi:hypothetical protein
VSYDIIGPEVLADVSRIERKGIRESILAFLEHDEPKKPSPLLPPLMSSPSQSTPPPSSRLSTPSSRIASNASTPPSAQAAPLVTGGTSPDGPPLEPVKKKTLRAGRKKVNISTSGDIVPLGQPQSSSSTLAESPDKLHSQSSTVKTLDQIMAELELKEAEALKRQSELAALAEREEEEKQKEKMAAATRGGGNRFFCCFRKNESLSTAMR